jgi:hypothetical protein
MLTTGLDDLFNGYCWLVYPPRRDPHRHDRRVQPGR